MIWRDQVIIKIFITNTYKSLMSYYNNLYVTLT